MQLSIDNSIDHEFDINEAEMIVHYVLVISFTD